MFQKSDKASRSRLHALVAIALVGLAIGGAVAIAGHLEGTSYTGCLALKGGTLSLIKEGDTPQKPCGPGTVEAHFGSGDITGVLAGAGLTGGGTDGSVTLSLAPTFQLPQNCASGQVAKWNGTGWSCGTDSDSQYLAGLGLQLIGSEFSIAPDYRVTNNQDCGGGRFASGIDGSGNLTCTERGGVQVFANQLLPGVLIGIPDNGTPVQVMALNVPAGIYSIVVTGQLSNSTDGGESFLSCQLFAGATFVTRGKAHAHDPFDEQSLAMTGFRALGAPTQLRVMCDTSIEGVRATLFGIQAVRIE